MTPISKRDFSVKRRKKLAHTGAAMADGGFPILNQRDLEHAEELAHHAKDQSAVRAHIRHRAKQLGLSLGGSFEKAWSDAARLAAKAARQALSDRATRAEIMGAAGTAGGLIGVAQRARRRDDEVQKDWAQFDQQRGAGQKTGRLAGTMAGIAGAAHAASGTARFLRRTGLKTSPRLALAGLAGYGAFQGLHSAGDYAGRKIDEALGRVFKAGFLGLNLGSLTPQKKIALPRQGQLQGRTRQYAGPNRAGGGPDRVGGGSVYGENGVYAKALAKEHVRNKVKLTMHEYKHGTLHSGSKHGPKVHSRAQAIAIALNQAGLSNQ